MAETSLPKKVPDSLVPMLNFTVGDAMCRDRYLTSVVNKLHKQGVTRLGHLVSLSEDDLSKILITTHANKERIKRCLSAFGLELGMAVAENSFVAVPGFPPRHQ